MQIPNRPLGFYLNWRVFLDAQAHNYSTASSTLFSTASRNENKARTIVTTVKAFSKVVFAKILPTVLREKMKNSTHIPTWAIFVSFSSLKYLARIMSRTNRWFEQQAICSRIEQTVLSTAFFHPRENQLEHNRMSIPPQQLPCEAGSNIQRWRYWLWQLAGS